MSNLDQYLSVKQEVDTANEVNEQSKAVYQKDLLYLLFKVLLFVVLAFVFLRFRKKVETPPVKVLA
jgi:flagellar biogenesis protein FliO